MSITLFLMFLMLQSRAECGAGSQRVTTHALARDGVDLVARGGARRPCRSRHTRPWRRTSAVRSGRGDEIYTAQFMTVTSALRSGGVTTRYSSLPSWHDACQGPVDFVQVAAKPVSFARFGARTSTPHTCGEADETKRFFFWPGQRLQHVTGDDARVH